MDMMAASFLQLGLAASSTTNDLSAALQTYQNSGRGT